MINAVLGLLGIWTLGVGYFFFKDICVHQKNLEQETHLGLNVGIGFLTDFLDTLGIGSFAVTTALFRGFKQVKDRLLPGTLNVGHALPTVCEALAFLTVIKVEFWTLVSMIAASVVGALGGAGIMSRLPERKIRLVMGFALLVTDFLMISGQMGWI
jgi:uncharacterized membrane protein YfcA